MSNKFKRIGPGSAKLQPNTEIKPDQTIRSTINSMNDVVQGFSSNQQKDNKKNYNNFSIFKDIKILINNIFLGLKSQRLRQKQHFEIVEKFTKTLLDKIDKLSKVNNTTQRDDYPKIDKELLDTFVKTFNKDILESLNENIQAINNKLKTDTTTQTNDINLVLSNFSTFLANQKTIISNISESNNKLLEKILSSTSIQNIKEQTSEYATGEENGKLQQNYALMSKDIADILKELKSINSKLMATSTENTILKKIEKAILDSNQIQQDNIKQILSDKQQYSSNVEDIEQYLLTMASNLKSGQNVINEGSTTYIVNKNVNSTSTSNISTSSNISSTANTANTSSVSSVINKNGYNALDFNVIRQLFVDLLKKQNQLSPQLTKSEKDIIHPYDVLNDKTSGKLLSLSGKPTHSMLFDNPNSLGIKVLTEFQHQNIKLLSNVKEEITNTKNIFLDYIKFNKDQLYRKNLYDSAMNDEGRYGGLSGGLLGLGGGSGNGRGGNDGDINDPNKKFNFGLLPTLLGGGAGVYGLYRSIRNIRQAYHNFRVRNRARRINNIRNRRIRDIRAQRAANRARMGRPRRLRDPKAVRARARNINRIKTKRINAARNARATSMKNAGKALRRGRGGGRWGTFLKGAAVVTAVVAPAAINYYTSKNDRAPDEYEEGGETPGEGEDNEEAAVGNESESPSVAEGISDTANAALLANMVKNGNLRVSNPLNTFKGWKSASKWGKFGKALGPLMSVAEVGLAGYDMYDAHKQAEELEKQGEFVEAEKLRNGSYADFGTSTAHAIAYAIPGVNTVVAASDLTGLVMDYVPLEKMGMSKEDAELVRMAFKPFEAISYIIKSFDEVSDEAIQKQAEFRRNQQGAEFKAVFDEQLRTEQTRNQETFQRQVDRIKKEATLSELERSNISKNIEIGLYPKEVEQIIREIFDIDKGQPNDYFLSRETDYKEKRLAELKTEIDKYQNEPYYQDLKHIYDVVLKASQKYDAARNFRDSHQEYGSAHVGHDKDLPIDENKFKYKQTFFDRDKFGKPFIERLSAAVNGDARAHNDLIDMSNDVEAVFSNLYGNTGASPNDVGLAQMIVRLLEEILNSKPSSPERIKYLEYFYKISDNLINSKDRKNILKLLNPDIKVDEKNLEDNEHFHKVFEKTILELDTDSTKKVSILVSAESRDAAARLLGFNSTEVQRLKHTPDGSGVVPFLDVANVGDFINHGVKVDLTTLGDLYEPPPPPPKPGEGVNTNLSVQTATTNYQHLLEQQLAELKKSNKRPPIVYYMRPEPNAFPSTK